MESDLEILAAYFGLSLELKRQVDEANTAAPASHDLALLLGRDSRLLC